MAISGVWMIPHIFSLSKGMAYGVPFLKDISQGYYGTWDDMRIADFLVLHSGAVITTK